MFSDQSNRYKTAEKLQDRLNELNNDLTEMINDINATSQTLSKSGQPDDPVSQAGPWFDDIWTDVGTVDQGGSRTQFAAF